LGCNNDAAVEDGNDVMAVSSTLNPIIELPFVIVGSGSVTRSVTVVIVVVAVGVAVVVVLSSVKMECISRNSCGLGEVGTVGL
jgi:hypothetical protein